MEYYIHRGCYQCGQSEKIIVTKEELAFSYLRDKRLAKLPCSNCGSLGGGSESYQMADLDLTLFHMWCSDSRLSLSEQDEDLMLADVDYLPMILDALDHGNCKKYKRHTLVSALCVLVYNHRGIGATAKEATKNREIVGKVAAALRERSAMVKEAAPSIMDYIKKVVFPLIGMN